MSILLAVLLQLSTIAAQQPDGVVLRIDGRITTEDPINITRNGHENVFILRLSASKTYTINMQSKQFDTYLIVENLRGEMLGSDDDGGGNLNSRLAFRPPSDGYYRIIATTFANGASGEYSLSITQ